MTTLATTPARTRAATLATTLATSLALLLSAPVAASAGPLDLSGGCAVAHAAAHGGSGGSGGGGRLSADRLEVLLPGQPDAALHAARFEAASHGAPPPPGALGQAGTAAAAVLLVAASGHRDGACSDAAFRDATAPLAGAVAGGGHVAFTWSGLSIRSGEKRLGARRLSLHLDGNGADATVTLSVDGAVSNDAAGALLPQTLRVAASLPAARIPDLLSAAGGDGGPVDVRIDSVSATRDGSELDGTGQARIAADPEDSHGGGHVSVRNYDALLDAAGAPGLEKLRTALFLARLMAHRKGDLSDWDIAWQGRTLTVNNVPLPLR